VKLAQINLSAALVDQPQLLQRLIKRGWDLRRARARPGSSSRLCAIGCLRNI
jgi:hypothetical protein